MVLQNQKSALRSKKKYSNTVYAFRKFLANFLGKLFGQAVFLLNEELKNRIVYKSYWGRGASYKQFVHISIFFITIGVFLTGLYSRLSSTSASQQNYFLSNNQFIVGNIDVLEQGGSLQTILVSDANTRFKYTEYIVQGSETLDSISTQFGIGKKYIKDSNTHIFNSYARYTNENLNAGEKLVIPEINGVIIEVQTSDTLNSIVSRASGKLDEVLGVNGLLSENDTLAGITKILVPNGSLPEPEPPPPEIPYENIFRLPTNMGVGVVASGELRGVLFGNPLSNPDCGGYSWSRGYAEWHTAVDLAKWGGCPVRSVAAGTVTYAGWSSGGQGYNVRVYHGNGIETYYYHAETIWVQTGDYVGLGQEVMYMGETGLSYGVHLHMELRVDGVPVDPVYYIPY